MHILSNISRSKNNQTMNFGQIIEYNMRGNFVEKSFAKYVVEKVFTDPFLTNQK